MTGSATGRALHRLALPLRVRAGAGWLALALGSAATLLGAAIWSARLEWISGPQWAFIAWTAVLLGVGAVAWLARGSLGALSQARIARGLEDLGEWRHGALTALLDRPAQGTSDALLRRADAAQASEVERRGVAAVAPLARPVRAVGLLGAAALLVGLSAFATAGPARGAAAGLWHPAAAWRALVAPVRLTADRNAVDRGDSVAFRVEALGRSTATLWLRAPGEAWRPLGVRLDSSGVAAVWSGPLASDVYARVTSGSRGSDTLLVQVRLPVFLGAVNVIAHYPDYLGLESEPVPTDGDTLLVPAGTRLETTGEATAPLASAAWRSGSRAHDLGGEGGSFSGAFVPAGSGEYRLALATGDGAPLAGDTVRLALRVVTRQRPLGRDSGARRGHPGAAESARAARGGCSGRLRHHGGHRSSAGVSAGSAAPTRRGETPSPYRTSVPTAPSLPTPSISTAAACFRATRSATTPWRPTTLPGARRAARASTCSACPR